MRKLKHLELNPIFGNAYSFIVKNNKGTNNSYHNNGHLYNVFMDVIDMCKHYNINGTKIISMGLAALFHDFDHNGTIGQDNINIDNSIKGFYKWYSTLNQNDIMYINTDLVEKMIKTTEFPTRPNPQTMEEMIMMDADMFSLYKENWVETVIIGLSKEFNVTIEKQIDNQIKFVNNLKFFTNYCNEYHDKFKNDMLNELTVLKSIFNNI